MTVDVANVPLDGVLESIGRQAGLRLVFGKTVYGLEKRVSLHVRDVVAEEAFSKALTGTGVVATITSGSVVFRKADAVQGIVTGKVIDEKTKQPLKGVAVTVDDMGKGVTTNEDGVFRLDHVATGAHTIRLRLLGYSRATRQVTVTDGETTSIDVTLQTSANQLNQVVVTGTVTATEIKAIPNAITVITAKQIEQRGITDLTQLFRGDVPGLWVSNGGEESYQNPGKSYIKSRGNSTLNGGLDTTSFVKTYVDGIEMTNAQYLGLIDTRTIERVEILTGPQAATVYGSNAMNGVIQIFTKRGSTPRPQLTLGLERGWIQNAFSSGKAPQDNDNVSLSGVEGHVSYNLSATWLSVGSWSPSVSQTMLSGSGGARLQRGLFSIDYDARRSGGRNQSNGNGKQVTDERSTNGEYLIASVVPEPTIFTNMDVASGVSVNYSPMSWWSHSVHVGQDALESTFMVPAHIYRAPDDTTLSVGTVTSRTQTLTYSTTVNTRLAPFMTATVTVGADGSTAFSQSLYADPEALTGNLTSSRGIYARRDPSHTRGGLLNGRVGLWDELFLTYAARGEWNPTYGPKINPNITSSYGASLSHDFGTLTMKLRGTYGLSTRPPTKDLTNAKLLHDVFPTSVKYYGDIAAQLPNNELLPENNRGGEGGLELYAGSRLSMVITRYNQTVSNLILAPNVDSVEVLPVWRTLPFCVQRGGCYWVQNQNANVGSVRNEGWELQGNTSAGPVSVGGTYTWQKSRMIGVTPRYKKQFPQYMVGAPFNYVPEHTWALNLRYVTARTSVSLNIHGQGQMGTTFTDLNDESLARFPMYNLRQSIPDGYAQEASGYAFADVNVQQRITSFMDARLQVANVAGTYRNDQLPRAANPGRMPRLGLHIQW